MNFWGDLKKPILALAPMADVTDAAFRYIIAKYSKQTTPQEKSQGEPLTQFVTFTEFTSAAGLILAPEEGRRKLLKNLEYSEIEKPIVAQLFTGKPEIMERAARLVLELGFDGLDINMGCPDKSVEKQGAGAALIRNPKLAREIIAAAKKGVNGEIPVSVKTRLGYNKDELETWLPELLAENPAAITIHARTRKDMSKVPARWGRIKRAVEIRDKFQNPFSAQVLQSTDKILLNFSSCSAQSASQGTSKLMPTTDFTLILGNGDVENVGDAYRKIEETGADGAMLGRAIFGNPWLFSKNVPTPEEKMRVMVEHTKLFEEKFGPPAGGKSFAIMKKHFKAYLSGIPNTTSLRLSLMETNNALEVEALVNKFLISYN